MNTNKITSLTGAADSASVFLGSTLDTSTESVASNRLEKGDCLTANPNYPVSQPNAEVQDGTPVAIGQDSTPTNWFELAANLCHGGYITETRMRRAMDAVRNGLEDTK